jgi:hypothetical protein
MRSRLAYDFQMRRLWTRRRPIPIMNGNYQVTSTLSQTSRPSSIIDVSTQRSRPIAVEQPKPHGCGSDVEATVHGKIRACLFRTNGEKRIKPESRPQQTQNPAKVVLPPGSQESTTKSETAYHLEQYPTRAILPPSL